MDQSAQENHLCYHPINGIICEISQPNAVIESKKIYNQLRNETTEQQGFDLSQRRTQLFN